MDIVHDETRTPEAVNVNRLVERIQVAFSNQLSALSPIGNSNFDLNPGVPTPSTSTTSSALYSSTHHTSILPTQLVEQSNILADHIRHQTHAQNPSDHAQSPRALGNELDFSFNLPIDATHTGEYSPGILSNGNYNEEVDLPDEDPTDLITWEPLSMSFD